MTTPRIKICGLTRHEDVDMLNAVLPDFAGFVFAQSKRQIDLQHAAELISRLDQRIQPVGVFVDAKLMEMVHIANAAGLRVIQLHGNEPPALLEQLRQALPLTALWKAHRITGTESDSSFMEHYNADAHLVDTLLKESHGGGGKCFNWEAAHYLQAIEVPMFLAGGLSPANVQEAIHKFHPYGVDLSSGVETLGVKDFEKIKAFVKNVRQPLTTSPL